MGGLSLASTMAVLLLLLLPLAYVQLHSTFGVHPTGVSYSNRSPQGLHGYYHHGLAGHRFGKREAEPYHGNGYLVAAYHPTHHAVGYGVHHHGYGKRSPTHNKRPKRPKPSKRPKRPKRPKNLTGFPLPFNQGYSGGVMHLHQNILQCVMEEGIPVTRVSMTEVTSVEEGEVSLQINKMK